MLQLVLHVIVDLTHRLTRQVIVPGVSQFLQVKIPIATEVIG